MAAREPQQAPESDLSAPTPGAIGAAVAAGKLDPGAPATMRMPGKMCLARFLAGFEAPGFDEAVATVRRG